MPPKMKSIQQKHVTDHRATYRYKPQRAILIIAFQKISQLVFRISEKVQFHRIARLLYHIFLNSSTAFSLFIAPNYLGSGKMVLRPCIPLAVYCVKLVVCDRRVANKVNFVLDNLPGKSYNTTPAEEKSP